MSFLSTFFQYASFTAGGSEAPGSIGEVTLDEDSPACLSFFRLVGATYFRAHASAFEFNSPVTLYHQAMPLRSTRSGCISYVKLSGYEQTQRARTCHLPLLSSYTGKDACG